jgi:hypothetical protein
MADQLQLRGGTTSENQAYTGAQREVTVDTDKHALVVHDGITVGGFPVATEKALYSSTIFFDDDTGGGSTADAYILAARDNSITPDRYNGGQYFGFITTNPNTGPATADFIGLGQKNIKYADGSDPEAGDIIGRVTVIYDADNDWFELQRKFTPTQVIASPSVRQTVLTGPVDSEGRADYIVAGTGLQALASGLSTTPLILSFGDGFSSQGGSVDVVVSVDSNQIFGGLVDNDINYLYLEYDPEDGTITPGSTIQAPTYDYKKPASPTSGDYWYPVDHRSRGEAYSGSWASVYRIYVGEAITSGGSVSSVATYAYQGRYKGVRSSAMATSSSYANVTNVGVSADLQKADVKYQFVAAAAGYSIGDIVDPANDNMLGNSVNGAGFAIKQTRNNCDIYTASGFAMFVTSGGGTTGAGVDYSDVGYIITVERGF